MIFTKQPIIKIIFFGKKENLNRKNGLKKGIFSTQVFFLIHPKYDRVDRTPTNYICHEI